MAWQATSEQNYSSVYTLHIQLKWLGMKKLMPLLKFLRCQHSTFCHGLEKRLGRKENSSDFFYVGSLSPRCRVSLVLEPEGALQF